jgi:acyl dehydratase
MQVFASLLALAEATGSSLGVSRWHRVTQERINSFAAATGDYQWIHVDPERAANGPYGTTIAHGYLALALIPSMVAEVYRVESLAMALNYGCERVRFPAPLISGDEARAVVDLLSVGAHARGAQVRLRVTVETASGSKPVCVAETVSLLIESQKA